MCAEKWQYMIADLLKIVNRCPFQHPFSAINIYIAVTNTPHDSVLLSTVWALHLNAQNIDIFK